MIEPEFCCETCDDTIPIEGLEEWACRCGAVRVEYNTDLGETAGFFLKSEGNVRLRGISKLDARVVESTVLEIGYAESTLGWGGAVVFFALLMGMEGRAGNAVARAAHRNPKVVKHLFCQN